MKEKLEKYISIVKEFVSQNKKAVIGITAGFAVIIVVAAILLTVPTGKDSKGESAKKEEKEQKEETDPENTAVSAEDFGSESIIETDENGNVVAIKAQDGTVLAERSTDGTLQATQKGSEVIQQSAPSSSAGTSQSGNTASSQQPSSGSSQNQASSNQGSSSNQNNGSAGSSNTGSSNTGNTNSGSGNNSNTNTGNTGGSNNGSTNTGNSGSTGNNGGSSLSQCDLYGHSWEDITEERDDGYYQTIFKTEYYWTCDACGFESTNQSEVSAHVWDTHGQGNTWTSGVRQVPDGQQWVSRPHSYVVGRKCTVCGKEERW